MAGKRKVTIECVDNGWVLNVYDNTYPFVESREIFSDSDLLLNAIAIAINAVPPETPKSVIHG